jgi:hypothetical protein
MATDWHDHWDKVPGGLTSYSTIMLVPPMSTFRLEDGTATTFLLFSRHPRAPLKAWTGKVTQINYAAVFKRVGFRVMIRMEIRFPRKYADMEDGWYLDEREQALGSSGLW